MARFDRWFSFQEHRSPWPQWYQNMDLLPLSDSSLEIVDRAGNSSLLSLVKTFDSVIDVYEGFCNLKQVDLKLKLCHGSSARKIIVREANSFSASKVLVGISKSHQRFVHQLPMFSLRKRSARLNYQEPEPPESFDESIQKVRSYREASLKKKMRRNF